MYVRGNSIQLCGFTLINRRGNSIGTDGPDRTGPDRTGPDRTDRTPFKSFKTLETNVSEFGGNFFSQPDRPSFFQSLGDENRKTKIRHTETQGNDGRQRRWPNSLPAASRTPILSTKIIPHAKGYIAPCLYFGEFYLGRVRGHRCHRAAPPVYFSPIAAASIDSCCFNPASSYRPERINGS